MTAFFSNFISAAITFIGVAVVGLGLYAMSVQPDSMKICQKKLSYDECHQIIVGK